MMDNNAGFFLEIIKCYLKEYKRTGKTVRIPLSIFHPAMTESIYLCPVDCNVQRKRFHRVKSQRDMDGLTNSGGFIEFKVNDPIKTVSRNIFDYAILKEIRRLHSG